MSKRVIEKFFSFARRIFFEEVSPKFRVASLKIFMDFAYIIFEKFAYTFEIISSNYLELYNELVEKEIKMAQISSGDSVLVIGCGSLPATSVLIAMKTKANTFSIDCDLKAIRNASRFIRKLHLGNHMNINYADGISYPINNYDVIVVLYGIKQQKEMLKYLSHNMKDNTRVIYRTTQDALDKTVGGTTFLSELFVVKNCVNSEAFYSVDSYLLLKKKQQ